MMPNKELSGAIEKRKNARPIGNLIGDIKNINSLLKTVKEFENSALGKIVMNMFGDYLPAEKKEKKFRLEVYLKSLKEFLIPIIITITVCYAILFMFKALIGVWLP